MKRFTEKIVNMMKYEKLFEPQGGPVILSQVCYNNLCVVLLQC